MPGAWSGFLARRLAGLLVVLAVLLFATFIMVRLIPGDPAVVILGQNGTPGENGGRGGNGARGGRVTAYVTIVSTKLSL